MPAQDPARSTAQRVADTRRRLEHDVDAWLATAGPQGPWLVPLTFLWDSQRVRMATEQASRTVRNILATPSVRVALGHTRDVVLLDGQADVSPLDGLDARLLAALTAKLGSDLREWADVMVTITPARIQAWREVNELQARTIFSDGRWRV